MGNYVVKYFAIHGFIKLLFSNLFVRTLSLRKDNACTCTRKEIWKLRPVWHWSGTQAGSDHVLHYFFGDILGRDWSDDNKIARRGSINTIETTNAFLPFNIGSLFPREWKKLNEDCACVNKTFQWDWRIQRISDIFTWRWKIKMDTWFP